MAVVSYSQYRIWKNCPLQWKLTYIDKIAPEEPSIYAIFGIVMHEILQDLLQQAYNKSLSFAKLADYSLIFKNKLSEEFSNRIVDQNGIKLYPCDKFVLQEFYEDGLKIIEYFQNHLDSFIENWQLYGVEKELEVEIASNILFHGYIDVIFYKPLTNEYRIVDFKTSVKGWNSYAKKDKSKTDQIVLYKAFFADQYDVPLDNISVEFIILKQKLYKNALYPQKRILSFVPSHGKISINNALRDFKDFVYQTYGTNGELILEQKAMPSKNACRFCPFRNSPEICNKSAWKDD